MAIERVECPVAVDVDGKGEAIGMAEEHVGCPVAVGIEWQRRSNKISKMVCKRSYAGINTYFLEKKTPRKPIARLWSAQNNCT